MDTRSLDSSSHGIIGDIESSKGYIGIGVIGDIEGSIGVYRDLGFVRV